MTNRVIGPGVALPLPQLVYPPVISGIPYTPGNNWLTLAPGDSIQIPAGDWMIDLGKYSVLEIQDPVNSPTTTQTIGVWRPIKTQRGTFPVRSDGVNFRISNLLGCAVGAVVTNGGANYVESTTTVTPSTGNSTWQAIVGGRVKPQALAGITGSSQGANYGLTPVVFVSAPSAPGVQATAYAQMTGTKVDRVIFDNVGAGYDSAPTVTILPNPFDPNAGTVVNASVVAVLTGSGAVSAVLCTNNGAAVASSMTLTIAGAGTSGLVTPLFLQTITAVTSVAVGTGSITGAMLTTTGGLPVAGVFTNPTFEYADFLPRQANVICNLTGTAVGGFTIIDGGMALGTIFPIISTYGGISSATGIAPTVTITTGAVNDRVMIQPL